MLRQRGYGSGPVRPPPIENGRNHNGHGRTSLRRGFALGFFVKKLQHKHHELEGVAPANGSHPGLDRSLCEDALRVRAEIEKIPRPVFEHMKSHALTSNKFSVMEIAGAKADPYFGSAQHREYGAYVAKLTGGAITAEEAMRMNPSGGLSGPGVASDGTHHDHAIRTDATGFLLSFLRSSGELHE